MSIDNTISVVIPMYNSAKTIIRALESVKIQRIAFEKVIVVNDASKDNSLQIVKKFKDETPSLNIEIIDSQNNRGASYSRNLGMKVSKGKYIAFLDADDEWLPGKIQTQFEVFKKYPHAGLVGTTRNNEKFKQFFNYKFSEHSLIPYSLLLLKNFFPTPTVIISRDAYEQTGEFDESMSHIEDQDYWLRVAYKFDCYLVNQSLVITGGGKENIGETGLSANLLKMELGELRCFSNAYKRKEISFFKMISLYLFSFLKFGRRLVQVGLRKYISIK